MDELHIRQQLEIFFIGKRCCAVCQRLAFKQRLPSSQQKIERTKTLGDATSCRAIDVSVHLIPNRGRRVANYKTEFSNIGFRRCCCESRASEHNTLHISKGLAPFESQAFHCLCHKSVSIRNQHCAP